MVESGDYKGALEHLNSIEKWTLDKIAFLERKAEIYLGLKDFNAAAQEYRSLLKLNSETYKYHYALLKALNILTSGLFNSFSFLKKLNLICIR